MNYEQLKVLVEGYSHRTDLRANGLLDSMVELAAVRIAREVRMMELERIATQTISGFLGLPRNFISMRAVTIDTARGMRVLQPVTPAQFSAGDTVLRADGIQRYCIKNDQIHIDGEAEVTLDYTVRPIALISDASSNFVLDRYPDLYLYATLCEVWMYAQDGDAYTVANQKFVSIAEEATAQSDRQRVGSHSSISRVDK